MNWGKGLTVAMILFMGFIITLVTIMIRTSTDLESEDYYSREVNYEQEIQAQKNANELEKISINEDEEHLVLKVPENIELPTVKVNFIRPNDKKMDKTFEFQNSKTLLVSKKELEKGIYKLEIIYEYEGKACLQKEEITL